MNINRRPLILALALVFFLQAAGQSGEAATFTDRDLKKYERSAADVAVPPFLPHLTAESAFGAGSALYCNLPPILFAEPYSPA